MESPQAREWGPALWTILHSLAERIGYAPGKSMPQEESRLWLGLLSSLRHSLPCPLCKKHYNDYFSKHPIQEVSKPFIRTWLFQLHSEVNERTNKENVRLEDIPSMYGKPFHFTHHYHTVMRNMKLAVSHHWCAREDIQRSLRFLEELRRFYDQF